MTLFSLYKLRTLKVLLTLLALPSIHATLCLLSMLVLAQDGVAAATDPPYGGTVYIDKDWLTPSDPSIYLGKSYIGVETFTWYDFRNNQWTDSSAYSYELRYEHGINVTASIPRACKGTHFQRERQWIWLEIGGHRDVDALGC